MNKSVSAAVCFWRCSGLFFPASRLAYSDCLFLLAWMLASCLHDFWRKVQCNSRLYSSVGKVAFLSVFLALAFYFQNLKIIHVSLFGFIWFVVLKIYFIVCVHEHLPVCVSLYHMCSWCLWRPEEGIVPWELELKVVTTSHICAGNQIEFLCQSKKWS